LVRKTARDPELTADAGRGLVEIVSRYTQTFLLLQRYDEGLLTEPPGTPGGTLLSAFASLADKGLALPDRIERPRGVEFPE